MYLNRKQLWFWPLVGLLFLLSFYLRYFQIEFENFSYDEMISLYFAKQAPLVSIFWDNSPGLFHFLYRQWVSFVGDSELATRMYSLIWSMATLLLLFRWLLKNQGLRSALWGLTLASIQFLSLLWARDARLYSQFEFFSTWFLLEFIELQRRGNQTRWRERFGFLAASLGLLLTHFLGLIPLAIALGWLSRKKILAKKIWWFLLAVCMLVFALYYWHQGTGMGWTKLRYQFTPYPLSPHLVLWDLFNQNWLCVIAFAGVMWDVYRTRAYEKDEVQFLLAYLVAPLIFVFLFSWTMGRAQFVSRYFIFMVPAVLLLFVLSCKDDGDMKKDFRWLVIFFVGSFLSIKNVYAIHKPPWQAAVQLISQTPNSKVFSRASEGIQEPYFNQAHIPVQKVSMNKEFILQIEKALDEGYVPWVVESYWGITTYFGSLANVLELNGLQLEAHSLKNGDTEPIVVLRISKVKRK